MDEDSPRIVPRQPRGRPATTLDDRENQLINRAVDLAEKQLRDGTASAQVITHYLKLGTTRERLEQEKLRRENALLEARATSLGNADDAQARYDAALNAFRGYSGQEDGPSYED